MKFSNKLSLVILITGMIVLILLSYTIYNISYNAIIKSQFMYSKSIADEISEDIDHLLHEKVKTTLTLANTPIIKKALEKSNLSYANLSDEKRQKSIRLLDEKWMSTKDPADNFILKFTDNKVSHFLKDQQALLKGEYGEIFLTNKFGALVASTSKLSTLAHGHKYWWLGSYDNGEGAVFFDDRGYDDSVGGYVLGLVVPVRKGTEIIGILKCNLNILGSISELISGAEDKLIGKFKLTRSGGMVVFEEGFEPLSTQIHDSIFKKLKSKNSDSFIINDSGEKYLVGFSEIKLTKGEKGYGFGGTFESIDHKKGNTGESWYVLCYRQMNVVLAPIIESIKSIVLIGSAIIIILVLVAYLFGRKIAKPLAILDKATEKIGKGDFEYRIDMRRKDEFGTLAHSFNSMAGKLHQTTTTVELLENEVKHRKQIEETLRKSEAKYRRLSENSPAVVYQLIMTPEGTFTFPYVSHKVTATMGISAEDVMKDSSQLLDMVHPEDQEMFREDIMKSAESLESFPITFRCLKDGEVIWIEARGTPEPLTDGGILWDGLFFDITIRKQMEEEVLKAKKLESLGVLAGGIAHDFNNLMSAVVGNISLAKMDMKPGSKGFKNLVEAEKASIQTKELTSRLITFSKGGGPIKETVSIGNLIKNSVGSSVKGSDIDAGFSIPDDISPVEVDEEQMKQAIQNIITNAQEAMAGQGTIHVSCENVDIGVKDTLTLRKGKYVKISLKDQGPGIPEEDLIKIFDPYFSNKEMGTQKGMGLGLAISDSIVKQHDGLITVESELGTGATFSIYLPASEKEIVEAAPVKKPVPEQPISQGDKILVMDDEELVRDVCNALLTHIGYKVEVAVEGVEAIEMYRKAMASEIPFDMVILDLTNKVGMGGAETIKRLLEIDPDIKAIVATGYSNDPIISNFREHGFRGALPKPFTLDQLRTALHDAIAGE